MNAVTMARLFHDTYERLAPQFGYSTRKESAVPWENVPAHNKGLMIATCAEVLRAIEESQQGQSERTNSDYAIEFGGYLADAVTQYLKARNSFDEKESTQGCDEGDADVLNDCRRALINAVGEFRKRAERAKGGADTREGQQEPRRRWPSVRNRQEAELLRSQQEPKVKSARLGRTYERPKIEIEPAGGADTRELREALRELRTDILSATGTRTMTDAEFKAVMSIERVLAQGESR